MLKNLLVWSLVGLAVVGIGTGAWIYRESLGFGSHSTSEHGDDHAETPHLKLKAVYPILNKQELVRESSQPVYVQAYYTAALMSRIAGVVKKVHKEIGDEVKAGEPLVEIDVPDLEQDLAQKEALVHLAEEEVKAARASLLATTAASREAVATVAEKSASVDRARSTRKFHQAAYNRVRVLADRSAIEASLVDERLRQVEASDADIKSSQAAVETAQANVEEFAARVQQAKIDVEVKQARVLVARADRDRAKTMVSYATLTAPFAGRVAQRHTDPGSFVHNASTSSRSEPLMTLVRTDKVTLVMWAPEREAPLIKPGLESFVRLDALGGKELAVRVSRVSGWLNPERARDMRVEVDLDNQTLGLSVGMYGSMRVILQRFEKAWLLPAGAVFARSGQTLIAEVVEGKIRLQRVRVLYEDGIRVKVAKLVKLPDAASGLEVDQEKDLTGKEIVVRSGQGEIREGQEVEVGISDW